VRKPDKRKSYDLDEATIKRVQRLLGAKTETEAIEKALELVTDEVRLAQALTHLLDKENGHLHNPTGFLKALAVDVGRSPVARAV
jgi:formate-dependent nitrite reductase cytochrome c552 subunit